MDIIKESHSPLCDLSAAVEKDKDAYYFYIIQSPALRPKIVSAVWICNRRPAPEKLDTDAMGKGKAPMMPKPYVSDKHPAGGMELDPEEINIIWFPSGESAAVFYGNELLCSIPPYAGYEKLSGWSLYVKGRTPYGWAMPPADSNFAEKEVLKAAKFWGFINSNPWPEIQKKHMDAIESFFGSKHEKYYAIDGGHFPAKAVAQGRRDGVIYGISLGVSKFPMPKIELTFADSSPKFCRTELGYAVTENHAPLCEMLTSTISSAANIPWEEISWLGHGHSFDFTNIKGFSAIILINAFQVEGLEAPKYPGFFGSKINLMWLVPITAEELNFLRENGIEKLLKLCRDITRVHIFDGRPKFIDNQ